MSREWTKEPWRQEDDNLPLVARGGQHMTPCIIGASGKYDYTERNAESSANLNRAMVCTNACAPLSDPTTSIPSLLRVAEAMKLARKYIEEAATPQGGYGFFCGGDPRDFVPDEESCSPEELAAHKKACEEADTEEKARKLSCPSGWVAPGIHVTRSPFGIGSYTYRDEQAAALLALVDQALSALPASDERAP